jgi:hypothetical protein
MERVARFQSLLFNISQLPHKNSTDKRHFTLLSKALGKERPPPCSPKPGPHGITRPFPEPYLAYLSGSPVREPSLQFPLKGLPQREMFRFQSRLSFIFQTPW